MLRFILRIALKIFLWCEVVAATLLMVASADIIGKRDLFLSVDVSGETAFLMTGGAGVAASDTTIGLEYESMRTHNNCRFWLALSAFSAFWRAKMQKVQKMQMVLLNFRIDSVTYLLEMDTCEPLD